MRDYPCIIFDLYNTILDDNHGLAEREQYRLDNIYTILEKSLFPVKFAELQKKYGEMIFFMSEFQHEQKRVFTPFQQVDYLLKSMNINDIIVFKKVYECYVDAVIQIAPRLIKNAERALEVLKERGKKIGLISNTGKTPGHTLRFLLKQLKVLDYFDDLTFSDEAGVLKPDRLIFDLSVRKLGVLKKNALFIGDKKDGDYDGAINAGLDAHLFKPLEEDLYQLAVSYSGDF